MKIKKKKLYQSISRDFNKAILGDYYSMVNNKSEIIDSTYKLEYLTNELIQVTSEFIKNNKDAELAVRIGSLSGLIWNLLENLE